jgi:PAS domain S-box-containing protein
VEGSSTRCDADASNEVSAPRDVFPARTATRMTMAMSLSFMTVVSATGSIEKPSVLAFLWLTALLNVPMAYHPRVTERMRAWYIAGTWLFVGIAALAESGLRGGPVTLLVALGLFGLFFGKRMALGVLGFAMASMVVAGVAEVGGWWAPRFGTPGHVAKEWLNHVLFFGFMGSMLALTLAATLSRAEQASARARQFALAAEHADRAMFVLDEAGAVAWVNDAFSKTTGITQEGAVGRTLAELLAGAATDSKALEALQPLRHGDPSALLAELVLYPREREPLWASVELRSMGEAAGYSGLLLDVTEAHAKAELEEVQRTLSTELSSATTLDAARAALSRALPRASAVLGARLLGPGPGSPRLVAFAVSSDRRHPAHLLEEALTKLPDHLDAVDIAPLSGRRERLAHAPLTYARERFRVEGATPTLLEVFFASDVPGRAALAERIPSLAEQVARHERRLAEQARFEALFDRSPDALVLLNARGGVARHNALASRLWPMLGEGLLPTWPSELLDATRVPAQPSSDEVRAVAWRNGEGEAARDLEANVATLLLPDLSDGRGVLVSVRDVTARREAERSLAHALDDVRAALSEREVLLKEVHHRVKNNLQIVSSLLSMQTDREASAETRAALEESVHRVRSMALIHQQLYGGSDLARIELDEYVKTLAKELCDSLAPTASLEFDTEPTEVDAEQAIPCGLILNELLVNALKHGRSASGECRVRVSVRREGALLRLGVADEGPGLPMGFDLTKLRRATTLGMRLVAALTRQLSATLTLEAGPGARFVLLVPSEEHTAAARGWTSARPTEGRPSLPM